MTDRLIEAIARKIDEDHRTRARFEPFGGERGADLAFAYDVQDRLVAGWRAEGAGDIVGWKIGLTSARMQAMANINTPCAGAILATRQRVSGAQLRAADFVRLGLEAELAVQVGETFPETEAVDVATARGRLENVSAAFEVVDDRHCDYARLDAFSLIADNSWNEGVVLGAPSPVDGLGPLVGRAGVLSINGEVADQGMSEDAGGDPLNVVAWLGAHLARRGTPLQPGQWIMTGSIVTTKFPTAGERYRFTLDGLAPVEVTIASVDRQEVRP